MFQNYKTELDFVHHSLDRECKMVIKNKLNSLFGTKTQIKGSCYENNRFS